MTGETISLKTPVAMWYRCMVVAWGLFILLIAGSMIFRAWKDAPLPWLAIATTTVLIVCAQIGRLVFTDDILVRVDADGVHVRRRNLFRTSSELIPSKLVSNVSVDRSTFAAGWSMRSYFRPVPWFLEFGYGGGRRLRVGDADSKAQAENLKLQVEAILGVR